jgi:hypothetical protein
MNFAQKKAITCIFMQKIQLIIHKKEYNSYILFILFIGSNNGY